MLLRVGVVAGDNVILLLTVALLLGRFVEAFPMAILWAAGVWAYTVFTVHRYLSSVTARAATGLSRH